MLPRSLIVWILHVDKQTYVGLYISMYLCMSVSFFSKINGKIYLILYPIKVSLVMIFKYGQRMSLYIWVLFLEVDGAG